MPCLYIIVPVYNEEGNIERLCSSFRQMVMEYEDRYVLHILIVDDGSTDATVERFGKELGALETLTILKSQENLGPGKAFGRAFEHLAAELRSEDWVVTMEGDNTSRYELLRQMFVRTQEGYDVILASVYAYGGEILNTSWLRVVLSNIANTFVKEFLGIHGIFTVSSFYRLFRGKVILDLQAHYGPQIVERSGFECMVEMLMKMIYLKTSISEVPQKLDTQLRVGISKMKITRTILGYFALLQFAPRWRAEAQKELN